MVCAWNRRRECGRKTRRPACHGSVVQVPSRNWVLIKVCIFTFRPSPHSHPTFSSNLTATLMNLDPPVPHHIHYPSDDVMIGMWVAGLYELHPSIHALPNGNANGNLECRTDDQIPGNPDEKLPSYPAKCPAPYSPHPIDSLWVDDEHGWHDYKHHGLKDAPTGWETTCVHRMSAKEMRAFRRKEEVKGEWDEWLELLGCAGWRMNFVPLFFFSRRWIRFADGRGCSNGYVVF